MDELVNVRPEEIYFEEFIKENGRLAIFKVLVRGCTHVLKVYHHMTDEYNNSEQERRSFFCESRAYRRLRAKGVCDRGIVPHFHGTIEPLEPKLCQPFLYSFLDDDVLPKAALLEFVPNMRSLAWSTYDEKAVAQFLPALREINDAWVMPSDVYPRNMMLTGDPSRPILHIDFDHAQTLPDDGSATDRQKSWFKTEWDSVKYIIDALVEDVREGVLNRAKDSVPDEPFEYPEPEASRAMYALMARTSSEPSSPSESPQLAPTAPSPMDPDSSKASQEQNGSADCKLSEKNCKKTQPNVTADRDFDGSISAPASASMKRKTPPSPALASRTRKTRPRRELGLGIVDPDQLSPTAVHVFASSSETALVG